MVYVSIRFRLIEQHLKYCQYVRCNLRAVPIRTSAYRIAARTETGWGGRGPHWMSTFFEIMSARLHQANDNAFITEQWQNMTLIRILTVPHDKNIRWKKKTCVSVRAFGCACRTRPISIFRLFFALFPCGPLSAPSTPMNYYYKLFCCFSFLAFLSLLTSLFLFFFAAARLTGECKVCDR